ncbi:hypothetical protein NE237_027593 [Protea cynaroides]|uniref:Secreted protein n=1 Tax=Protea cynaroides TaxID=273540 RepID=A0A9Q0JT57_9MAGN|nr:hypothetical protein NE237_027593 [Protea cynaroides]
MLSLWVLTSLAVSLPAPPESLPFLQTRNGEHTREILTLICYGKIMERSGKRSVTLTLICNGNKIRRGQGSKADVTFEKVVSYLFIFFYKCLSDLTDQIIIMYCFPIFFPSDPSTASHHLLKRSHGGSSLKFVLEANLGRFNKLVLKPRSGTCFQT